MGIKVSENEWRYGVTGTDEGVYGKQVVLCNCTKGHGSYGE